jgi:hypothetical protein
MRIGIAISLDVRFVVHRPAPMQQLNLKPSHKLLPQGGSQRFSFYTYDEGGSNRRENITDWALNKFRTHYNDPNITKWDIFHYAYAVLHHPEYRERYAANLKRELPRIPFVAKTESAERETNLAHGVSPGSALKPTLRERGECRQPIGSFDSRQSARSG